MDRKLIYRVPGEFKNSYRSASHSNNARLFFYIAIGVMVVELVQLGLRLFSPGAAYEKGTAFYTYVYTGAAAIMGAYALMFHLCKSDRIKNNIALHIIEKSFTVLLVAISIWFSLASSLGGYLQTAVFIAVNFLMASMVCYNVITVIALILGANAAYFAVATMFPGAAEIMVGGIPDFVVVAIVACFAAYPFYLNRIERFMQQIHITQSREELKSVNRHLEELMLRDPLTYVFNRRAFDKQLYIDWARCQYMGLPISAIMLDLDFFKNYNDFYGHQAGDECLKKVASTIAYCLKRTNDKVFRYGGEEFIVLLSGTDAAGAMTTAQRIINAVEELKIPHEKSDVREYVTISAGISTVLAHSDSADMRLLVERADRALYWAKANGRAQAVAFEE